MNKHTTQVRVRFAPSPTGFLHIGSLRTALFNWLFARHLGGKFLVRIEDTDRERFSQDYEDAIITALQWSGITADEPYVYQHARQAEHRHAAQQLIDQGKAYYCFCTVEELEQKRLVAQAEKETYIYDTTCRDKKPTAQDLQKPHVIRFNVAVDAEFLSFDDMIRGKVSLPTEHIDDFVITRTDGGMTYNFAVVVDDHYMNISHVIRGEDHIVNTGKQILLYQAFGWDVPTFAHVPLILGPTGQKLSKRDAAVGVQEYQDQGFLPQALCNYLVRLGWSHGDQEIFSTQELIEYFTIADVNTHGAIFDYHKLLWTNSVYIKSSTPAQLLPYIHQNLDVDLAHVTSNWDQAQLEKVIPLFQERSQTLQELVTQVLQLYHAPASYDQTHVDQWLTDQVRAVIRVVADQLLYINFTKDDLQDCLKRCAKDHGLKFAEIAQPIRIALFGSSSGPGVFEMLEILGKEESLARIHRLLGYASITAE